MTRLGPRGNPIPAQHVSKSPHCPECSDEMEWRDEVADHECGVFARKDVAGSWWCQECEREEVVETQLVDNVEDR